MLPLDDKVVMATTEQTNLWWKRDESNEIIFTQKKERKMPNSVKRGTSPTKARISETKLPAILHVECCFTKTSTACRATAADG